jgi:hypothetical protein
MTQKIPTDLERETKRAQDALTKSNTELVEKIFFESNNRENSDAGIISRPLAYFSALLSNLAEQSVKQNEQNIKLQKTIKNLTWVIFFLTLVILGITVYQVLKP